MTREEWLAAMGEACPHSAQQPCTCAGCWACTGRVDGCTCDIDWDVMMELIQLDRDGGVK